MMPQDEPLLAKQHGDGGSRAGGRLLSMSKGLAAAGLYGFMSIAVTFVNKYTMQVFSLSNVVMVFQMLATLALLQPALEFGALSMQSPSMARAKQFLYITVFYTLNTAFALAALRTLGVPMYNVLKRLTPVIVLGVKAVVKRQRPPVNISCAVILLVLGCVVAGMGDLQFDTAGYTLCLLSSLCQAGYLLLVEWQGGDCGASSAELLYYGAIWGLPFLSAIALFTGEFQAFPHVYAWSISQNGLLWFWGVVGSCAVFGCFLNYSLFLCTSLNSALTTTIVGVLKSVISIGLGFVLLGGVPQISSVNIAGIALNTLGGIWYAKIKYEERSGRAPHVQA